MESMSGLFDPPDGHEITVGQITYRYDAQAPSLFRWRMHRDGPTRHGYRGLLNQAIDRIAELERKVGK